MEWYEWMFDGIGTTLVAAICSLISYKAAIKKIGRQSQIAGDDSKQKQELNLESGKGERNVQSAIKQTQKAGNNAEQIQCGGFGNGE